MTRALPVSFLAPFLVAVVVSVSVSVGAAPAAAGVGQDEFLEGVLPIPAVISDAVATLLPETSNAGAAYISDTYSPNLLVTEPATVEVIFLWEGAGYRNSVGYFTWDVGPSGAAAITSRQLVFPNASFPGAGVMQIGHYSTLRDAAGQPRLFQPGDRIGFFLAANGYGTSAISQFDPATSTIPSTSPAANAGVYTTIDAWNPENTAQQPELARHVAMIRMDGIEGFLGGEDFFLVGMEDLNRVNGSDDDFNDFVAIVHATPPEAILDSPVFTFADGDPDGDGVVGVADHYPLDPERATVHSHPSFGFGVLGFEDNYPHLGDGDYNDAVVAYRYDVVRDAAGRVKDVLGTFHLLARGAGYDHRFGVHFPALPDGITGSLELERFLSNDEGEHLTYVDHDLGELLGKHQRRVTVIPSTKQALPPSGYGNWTNTVTGEVERPAASSRFRLTFDAALEDSALGVAPFDAWFGVLHGGALYDVHVAGQSGFADRPAELPEESGPGAFLDDEGYPWILDVPYDWRFPREQVLIDQAFADFATWRGSGGVLAADWYDGPKGAKVCKPSPDYLPTREW